MDIATRIKTLSKFMTITEFTTLSSFLGLVVWFVEKYIFNDWEFITMLIVLIILDTVLGIVVAGKYKKVSSDGFAKFGTKIIVYMVMLICTHTAVNIRANGSEIWVLGWIDSAVYSGILVREILSLFEKCAHLKPDLVPKWILERLKQYNEKGKIEDESDNNRS